MISFYIPGTPVAKGRARISTLGGKIRSFTPAKTVAYERDVATAAREAMGGRAPLEGAVELSLFVELHVPPSWSKKRQLAALAGEAKPTGRPDLDNYIKSVCDGGNGILWHDDAQIALLRACKRYAAAPGVCVEVSSIA